MKWIQILGVLGIIGGFSVALAPSVSHAGDKEWDQWTQKMKVLRETAQVEGHKTPYRQDQYAAFKAYFGELNRLALGTLSDDRQKRELSTFFVKVTPQVFCERVLISKREWKTIFQNCFRNNYFVCSEEVRVFGDTPNVIKARLPSDLQKRFNDASDCQGSTTDDEGR